MNKDINYLIGQQMSPSESRRILTGETEEKSIIKYFELNSKKFTEMDLARIIIVLVEFKLNKSFSYFKQQDFETLDAFEIYNLLVNPTLEKIFATKYNKIGYLLLKKHLSDFLDLSVNKINLLSQVFKKYNFSFSDVDWEKLIFIGKTKKSGKIINLLNTINLNSISE